ncbi:MAG: helicase-exonuclease AddAB subunit AddA [Lachnospiraceae bacterium]|nr:helicase-exonuclease AddAB subunit AddA [Lachnospiraceae bacterium]
MGWTRQQEDAINIRNRECIVSASAGSGKTAVLIERIFNMITDKENPIDVDRLLVVTFTRAAAAEMRERLTRRIDEALSAGEAELSERERANLIRQSALVNSAQISTIDSFCKKVVSEHFDEADIDPAFRTPDDAEVKLLRSDVMDKFLESKYAEKDPAFLSFAKKISGGKYDDKLSEIIEDLYTEADSTPDPEGWLAAQMDIYNVDGIPNEEFLMSYSEKFIQSAVKDFEKAVKICEKAHFNDKANSIFSGNYGLVKGLLNLSFEELYGAINGMDFGKLYTKKACPEEEIILLEEAAALRNRGKEKIGDLKKAVFADSKEDIIADTAATKEDIRCAINLTIDFKKAFEKAKRKKNIADFSDVAHMALKVLVGDDGNPTPAAAEYREKYVEILIDEYQDSNDLQENILRSISGEKLGKPNIFMVGDVKQSIYSFRQAKPELFVTKYNTYNRYNRDEKGTLYEKIVLGHNFRSTKNVLTSVNIVFSGIMQEELGGVNYDKDALLISGDPRKEDLGPDEILLLDQKEESENVEFDSKIDAEASMVSQRIRELHKEGVNYGDIVILLRSMKGWGDIFVNILNNEGIPAVCETSSGYFSAWEVQVILNLLTVLDNPRSDIPLASVMMSYIGGFTPDDMAKIRITAGKTGSFYDALLANINDEKCADFIEKIGRWRSEVVYRSINELIGMLYNETKFYEYASTMPGGIVRRANLDMLREKASAFEESAFHGLFHFVRYIEKLKKYEVDYGEATASAGENVVRIMSIHKSKGLQFPVCFVSGAGKSFNTQDEKKILAVHGSFGTAMKKIDLETRTSKVPLLKKLITKKMHEDALGEELRIYYVAMTRAEKRLIITGVSKDFAKLSENAASSGTDFAELSKCGSFLDMLMRAYYTFPGVKDALTLKVVTTDDLLFAAKKTEYERHLGALMKLTGAIEDGDPDTIALIERESAYRYPYMEEALLKGKMTVSEIKALSHSEEEFGEIVTYEKEPYIPAFAREEEKIAGNERGTIYHSVMEHMDFEKMAGAGKEEVTAYIDNEVKEGRLTPEDRKAVSDYKIRTALCSSFAERMKAAYIKNVLHRESPFVIAVENDILIQGIIDVWWEEDDGIVLLDYKTDRVPEEGGEKVLTDRYKIQLDYYERALLQTTDKKVKERIIYSFGLGKEITL